MNISYDNKVFLSSEVSFILIEIHSTSENASSSYSYGEYLKSICESVGWKVLLIVTTPKEEYRCTISDGASNQRLDPFKIVNYKSSYVQ